MTSLTINFGLVEPLDSLDSIILYASSLPDHVEVDTEDMFMTPDVLAQTDLPKYIILLKHLHDQVRREVPSNTESLTTYDKRMYSLLHAYMQLGHTVDQLIERAWEIAGNSNRWQNSSLRYVWMTSRPILPIDSTARGYLSRFGEEYLKD
jgi:hypothetical protein